MTNRATTIKSPTISHVGIERPRLGTRLRELRKAKQLTLRQLADRVEVGFTYLSKIENGKLEDGHSPSDQLLVRMAEELAADATELLLLAEKIPDPIRRRFIERPEAFALLAKLEDNELDRLLKRIKVSDA